MTRSTLPKIAVLVAVLGLATSGFSLKELITGKPTTRSFTVLSETVNGKTRYFPSTFVVKKGETVKLTLLNLTRKVHGFSINEFGLALDLKPREETFAEFKADRSGIFRVYCHYHPAHLPGQLLVR